MTATRLPLFRNIRYTATKPADIRTVINNIACVIPTAFPLENISPYIIIADADITRRIAPIVAVIP